MKKAREYIVHKIMYYDKDIKEFNVVYYAVSTYREAISLFRQDHCKEVYDIEEVCKVINGDWSEY